MTTRSVTVCPPKATRFAKGTSGNPSGRPRGSRDLRADLQDELTELISVNDEAGGSRRITKQRALVKAIVQKALSGDVRAVNALFALTVRGTGHEADELAGREADDDALLEEYVTDTDEEHTP